MKQEPTNPTRNQNRANQDLKTYYEPQPPNSNNCSSFQVWQKPHSLMKIVESSSCGGASGSGTKPQDDKNSTPFISTLNDEENKMIKKKICEGLPPIVKKNLSIFIGGTPGGDNVPIKVETINGVTVKFGPNIDPNLDDKKLRRVVSNRISAQKARLKRMQYVTEMERRVKALETQISMLGPQVSMYKNQQELLQKEHKSLNQKMTDFTISNKLKDAEIEMNKKEVTRLRQLHLKLQQYHSGNLLGSGMLNWNNNSRFNQQPLIMNQSTLNQSAGMGSDLMLLNSNQGIQLEDNETNKLNHFNMTQQQEDDLGFAWTPSGWEGGMKWAMNAGENATSSQSILQPNLIFNSNQSLLQSNMTFNSNQSSLLPNVNFDSNFGGIEQFIQFDEVHPEPPNYFI